MVGLVAKRSSMFCLVDKGQNACKQYDTKRQ